MSEAPLYQLDSGRWRRLIYQANGSNAKAMAPTCGDASIGDVEGVDRRERGRDELLPARRVREARRVAEAHLHQGLGFRVYKGYLAHKKPPYPRTLP